jgi:signal transduction histidine kinase
LELGQAPLAGDAVDMASEATALLERFESFAAARFVTLEAAVAPSLSVRVDPRALREILSDLLARAIETSPGGRVLLTAADVAGRVQVTVSDDGARADRDVRASWLRSAQRLTALQGATMDIDARSGQGTTVIVRIPVSSADSRRSASASAALDPASVWSARKRAREDSNAGR